jgi:hypothetical protein
MIEVDHVEAERLARLVIKRSEGLSIVGNRQHLANLPDINLARAYIEILEENKELHDLIGGVRE